MKMERQYDAKTMAEIFGTTAQALRQRLYDNPQSLPPSYRLGKLLMWDPKVVEEWKNEQMRRSAQDNEVAADTITVGVKPGPRKRRSRKMREAA